MYRARLDYVTVLCAAGQEPVYPVTNIPCLLSLPACEPRAEQRRTQAPFRPTHRGGAVPSTGPPCPRRVAIKQAPCRLRQAGSPEGSPIHRTGRGRKNHPTSGFGARDHRGEASGSGRRLEWRPNTGPSPSEELWGRQGSAAAGGGSRTSDGSCCAPVPVSQRVSGQSDVAGRRFLALIAFCQLPTHRHRLGSCLSRCQVD